MAYRKNTAQANKKITHIHTQKEIHSYAYNTLTSAGVYQFWSNDSTVNVRTYWKDTMTDGSFKMALDLWAQGLYFFFFAFF